MSKYREIPLSQRLDLLFVLWCKSADSPAPYADIAAEVSRRTGMVLTADEVEDIRFGHRLPDSAVAIAIAEALGWDEPVYLSGEPAQYVEYFNNLETLLVQRDTKTVLVGGFRSPTEDLSQEARDELHELLGEIEAAEDGRRTTK
ncbi:hypothetical protein WSS_A29809 [Rhodococcus opacus M213]|uniref:Uncharacterized protein n=1 Tax=Rhodococcus opacus M213 TaxID=1129896 RepID=K8XBR4_RHOOP|nr:hypothetical protein [Rhodococcus opacus]EKT78968.1 hypothetical protein WSS_A29809 [Rhodococcus opacus M213]